MENIVVWYIYCWLSAPTDLRHMNIATTYIHIWVSIIVRSSASEWIHHICLNCVDATRNSGTNTIFYGGSRRRLYRRRSVSSRSHLDRACCGQLDAQANLCAQLDRLDTLNEAKFRIYYLYSSWIFRHFRCDVHAEWWAYESLIVINVDVLFAQLVG